MAIKQNGESSEQFRARVVAQDEANEKFWEELRKGNPDSEAAYSERR